MTAAPAAWRVVRLQPDTAAPGDVAALAALEASAFHRPVDPAAVADALRTSPAARVYVLRGAHGQLGGFCACFLVLDELHVNSVVIVPELRRQGLALALMRQVLAAAAAEGARRATLEVRQSNTAARALYARLGFRQRGLRRDYYSNPTENGLILWLDHIS